MNPKDFSFIKQIRRICFLIIFSLTVCGCVCGQEVKLQNKPYMDLRKFHYGFMIGLHEESLHLKNNGLVDPETGRQWFASNSRYDPSFTVGILGEWRLDKYFALRLLPTMHFGSKYVVFRDKTTGETQNQDIKSTYIAFPINLKFSAPRFNNYRPYFMAGIDFMYDLTTKDNGNLKLKAFNSMLEVGLGCDYYLPFFKLIPELKFCFGLNNILEKNRQDLQDRTKYIFTQSIDNAHTNMIVLTLYFE